MSTSYYIKLKDDHKLDETRNMLKMLEEHINKIIELETEQLGENVMERTKEILEKDNFNKQFCNSASWYGGYPTEPEDYHLKRIYLQEIEDIKVLIGVYSGGEFKWKLNGVPNGYYDLEGDDNTEWYDMKEKRVYEFPRSKEQFKEFMKKYKDKVEIVDEYSEVYTLSNFLKKVDEY